MSVLVESLQNQIQKDSERFIGVGFEASIRVPVHALANSHERIPKQRSGERRWVVGFKGFEESCCALVHSWALEPPEHSFIVAALF